MNPTWDRWRLRSRFGLVLLGLMVVAACLASACDNWVDYTVVNDTNQDLLTWGRYSSCTAKKWQDDYLGSARVAAHTTYNYDGRTGANVRCVEISTADRRLVLSQSLDFGAIYTIRDPLTPAATPEPDPATLPRRSRWQQYQDAPLTEQILYASLVAALIGAFSFATHYVVRRIRRPHLEH